MASISQRGIKGEIRFSSGEDGTAVTATADLFVGLGAEGEYTWGVYEFPIDYTKVNSSSVANKRPGISDQSEYHRALCSPGAMIVTWSQS